MVLSRLICYYLMTSPLNLSVGVLTEFIWQVCHKQRYKRILVHHLMTCGWPQYIICGPQGGWQHYWYTEKNMERRYNSLLTRENHMSTWEWQYIFQHQGRWSSECITTSIRSFNIQYRKFWSHQWLPLKNTYYIW